MSGSSVPPLVFAGLLALFALLPLALQLRRRTNVDSPWFWGYWFGIFALVALFLAYPKFQQRQSQIEREYQGRTRATQNVRGQAPDVELSAPGRTEITLRPLFAGLTAVTLVSWVVYWWTRPQTNGPREPNASTKASAA